MALQAVALPRDLSFSSTSLPSKPNAPIRYAWVPPSGLQDTLMIFLNGLGLPQAAWHPVIALYIGQCRKHSTPYPAMLTYDRFGQGQTTARDPVDSSGPPGHGHDLTDAVQDLKELIQTCCDLHKLQARHLIFVANSIGCVLARLYAQTFPGTVGGLVFLDSNMSNCDFVDLWPDPDASGFDAGTLPNGVTSELLRETRAKYSMVFHPSVVNSEGLSRLNVEALVPHADTPQLVGPGDKGPLVTVVGHDPDRFAWESETGRLQTPRILSMAYSNPTWHRYNQGLVKITSPGRGRGPIIASGCGHFIQRDDPSFVSRIIADTVNDLRQEKMLVSVGDTS